MLNKFVPYIPTPEELISIIPVFFILVPLAPKSAIESEPDISIVPEFIISPKSAVIPTD